MKILINKYRAMTAVMMMAALTFAGCGEDDVKGEEDIDPATDLYVDVTYTLNCSEDLIRFATPTVTYTDADGNALTVSVSETEWADNNDFKVSVTHNGTVKPGKVRTWTKTVRFTRFPVNADISVAYTAKTDLPGFDKDRIDMLYHGLFSTMKYVDKANNKTQSTTYNMHDLGCEINDNSLGDFASLLEDTGVPFITRSSDNQWVVIKGAGDASLRSVINSFADRQTIKVERNGKYTVEDEENPYVNVQAIDAVYMLNCSEDLLKHSDPEVTYTGETGEAIVEKLSISDFEVNPKVRKWGKHDHGEADGGTRQEGEEDAVVMVWKKQVHLEDADRINGKMTVRYIPKDNASEMRLSHAFHSLSAGAIHTDADGNRSGAYSYNRINSETVNGERQMVWQYQWTDQNGVPGYKTWIVDALIGNDSISFTSSDGKPVTVRLSDFIFESFRDTLTIRKNGADRPFEITLD